jgi:hypothetical protein
MPLHASFPLSQDELAASALASGNALSCCLPSRAKTEAFNPHHHRRLLSPDSLAPTLYYYKKNISTLATLRTIQPRLHFTSSIARAPRHQSSTHCCHSLSFLSHAHHPSIQWHMQWRTSRPSFASWIVYQHVNSRKKIFWNAAASRRVIN